MKKYIVLVSHGIGGAEKRFFDIFLDLIKNDKSYFLVAPSILLDKLDSDGDIRSKYSDNFIIIKMDSWSFLRFVFLFFKNIIVNSNKDDVFHYPLNPLFFLHLFPFKRSFNMSLCYCYDIPRLSIKSFGLSLQYIAAFFARKIDILNNDIYVTFLKKHNYFRDKCYLSIGGSYIRDNEVPCPACNKKEKEFVFISRLESGKGVEDFLALIPKLNLMLVQFGITDHIFKIFGEGSLSVDVVNSTIELVSRGINVQYCGYQPANQVLPQAWCVFSLQRRTNYPSRVVAEALLFGCEVVVLNSGNSKDFGSIVGLHYLECDLSNIDVIIRAIVADDLCNSVPLQVEIAKASKAIFSNKKTLNYFAEFLNE